jgi:pimeloyl-ACP methyl ester carboxylesterase
LADAFTHVDNHKLTEVMRLYRLSLNAYKAFMGGCGMPTIHVNGMDMYVEEQGEGEALVLIMGLGADGSLWQQHVDFYSRHFRCILIDNRGAGRSAKPIGPYTTAMMAADTLFVMNSLGIDKAHVSGISMGGAITQELALLAPERIQTMTLISTWQQCDVYTTRVFEMLRSLITTSDPVTFGRMLQLWIFAPLFFNHQVDELLHREELGKLNPYPMPQHAFQAQCDACLSHYTAGKLSGLQMPVLITVGDKDIFTPLHYSAALAEEIPGSELLVFEDCGHAHHWEQLELFNEETLNFMLKHRLL